jgi:small-conductance mechanosensitive channel
MGCFTLQWLQQVLVYCIVLGAVYAILKLLIPLALSNFPPIVGQVAGIILWAIIAIIIVYICFALISCLLSMGGGLGSLMPPTPHR